MSEQTLQQQLGARYRKLDRLQISPPIEIAVGDYAFYPYRGFCDVLERDDFRKLSSNQLRTLIKIADDILAMQRTELFEAFVNDDGIIVVDKAQPHVEYSIDIEYNDARSRVEEIYPQVTYPQGLKPVRVQDRFVRNDTAHEVTHHIDYWLNMESKQLHLDYLHSSSTLLVWLEELDRILHPQGVAELIGAVREAEGYVAEALLDEGYTTQKVDQMLRAEFFAIAGEYYYGSPQASGESSPLLEAYMRLVLDTDLEIQRLYIPFRDMETRRGVLRAAIHAPLDRILREDANAYHALRRQWSEASESERQGITPRIESLVIGAMGRMMHKLRQRVRLASSSE
jgi:hypothetical protein